jgi:hypothetical protein
LEPGEKPQLQQKTGPTLIRVQAVTGSTIYYFNQIVKRPTQATGGKLLLLDELGHIHTHEWAEALRRTPKGEKIYSRIYLENRAMDASDAVMDYLKYIGLVSFDDPRMTRAIWGMIMEKLGVSNEEQNEYALRKCTDVTPEC